MALSEVDSFIQKFNNLLKSGKNAHPDIKSEAGKASIKLTVEFDLDTSKNLPPFRNGPSRQRRRERRAAERAAAAEEVVKPTDGSNSEKEDDHTRNISDNKTDDNAAVKARERKTSVIQEVSNRNVELETITDANNSMKEEVCTAVSIIPVRGIDANDEAIEKVVKEKLGAKSVIIVDMFIYRSLNVVFTRCDVKIEPVEGHFREMQL